MTKLTKTEKVIAKIIRSMPKELTDPIVLPNIDEMVVACGDALSAQSREKRDELATQEVNRKVALLQKYYGIEPNSPNAAQQLAVKLIQDFIPGVQPVEERVAGQRSIWTEELSSLLWCQVQLNLRSGRASSARQACSFLMKEQPWKVILESQSKLKEHRTKEQILRALYLRYLAAQKLAVPVKFHEVIDRATDEAISTQATPLLCLLGRKMAEAFYIRTEGRYPIPVE